MAPKKLAKPMGIFSADTHLDLNNWSARPDLYGDSQWALEYLVSQTMEMDFLCLAGDLFDVRKPSSEVIRHFRTQISRLAEADKDFFFIQGQHCMADPPWPTSTQHLPVHLHHRFVEFSNGMSMFGLDWTPGDRLMSELAKVPHGCDIFVCHQVWLELMGTNIVTEGSFTAIPHATTVLTGDYHENKVIHDLVGASCQTMTIYSPGSTNMRGISEPPDKFYFVLREDGSWTKHKIPTRPVITAVVSDQDDLDLLLDTWPSSRPGPRVEGLPEHLTKPILWFKFYDDIDSALQKLHARVKDSAFIFPKMLVRESADETIELTRRQREDVVTGGLSGCLKLLVPEDDPQYDLLLSLLNDQDPESVLQQLRQKHFEEVEDAVEQSSTA